MDITFFSLGSGSCGNCYYLSTGTDAIIIDCGVGIRRFKKHLSEYGMKLGYIKAMLITHDHSDHIKAAGKISKEYHLPVYATPLVHQGMDNSWQKSVKVPQELKRTIAFGETFEIGPFSVTPFPVPHDASENTGYSIEVGGVTFTIMTDVGEATDTVKRYISLSSHLVFESNYDDTMLQQGRYPAVLKTRIASGHGHLSNAKAAQALADNMSDRLRHVWLCHLSEENNLPEIALETTATALKQREKAGEEEVKVDVLRRTIPTGPFRL